MHTRKTTKILTKIYNLQVNSGDKIGIIKNNQTGKQKTNTLQENYRPKILVTRDAKFFNKILAKRIQRHMKKILHYIQVRFVCSRNTRFHKHSKTKSAHEKDPIPWSSEIHLRKERMVNLGKSINVLHHNNRMKTKNHIIISRDAEKSSNKFNIHSW